MGTGFHNPALIHHKDSIGNLSRPNTMGTFVNDVRPKKRRSLEEISSLLTKGGRSPTGVNKLGRTPNPAVFGLEISNQEPT